MPDYRQSKEYSCYFENSGWVVEKVKETVILIKRIPLIGSVIKIQRCTHVPFAEIEKISRREKALYVIVEAAISIKEDAYAKLETDFKKNHYQNLRRALCPSKTSYINLTKTEEEILASFDETAKKSIKRNQAQKITIKITESLAEIYPLLQDTGKISNFFVQPLKDWQKQWGGFGEKAQVILAYKNNELLGGNMSLITPPQAFGLFLPSTATGRTYNIATTLLWEGLKLAKKNGCTTFDLDGIYDDRSHSPKKWLGLTAFKRKFRGQEIEFIRAKIKIYAWFFKPLGWFGLV
ncbi:MAG: peptidoglycan bridge formation glycyltransferase FemA/FemB family protein [candidate division WWE3 bacterium]|nr:peptidoglycan bridge formation glycyltransferase FemA/FemB family protein [candidate division WWE3 bacterium]